MTENDPHFWLAVLEPETLSKKVAVDDVAYPRTEVENVACAVTVIVAVRQGSTTVSLYV